jgi:hypothetical protein
VRIWRFHKLSQLFRVGLLALFIVVGVSFGQSYTGCNGQPATGQIQLWTTSVNASSGVVGINGVAIGPFVNAPFTWAWGDGISTQGWFPQTHTYADVHLNYNLQVSALEDNGSTDCAQLTIVLQPGQPIASAPTINSLSPAWAVGGMATLAVRVSGSNFVSNSAVTYNGASHAATFVSSTQLTISLSPGDQAAAGSYPVVVTNPLPGGLSSTPFYFTVVVPSPPIIGTLSPPSATTGTAAQNQTINGGNFGQSSTVTYNSARCHV